MRWKTRRGSWLRRLAFRRSRTSPHLMVRVVQRIHSIVLRLWLHSNPRRRDLNGKCGFIRIWFAVMARFHRFGRSWARSKAGWAVVTIHSLAAAGNIMKARTSMLFTERRSKLLPVVALLSQADS